MELSCPKCQAPMRSYERNGVTVDQCTECRGIFLDRGELERLADAESSYYGGDQPAPNPPASAPAPQAGPAEPRYQQPPGYQQQTYQQPPPYQQPAMPYRRGWGSPGSPDSPDRYGYGHPGQHRRRRKSFLGELFD